MVDASRTYSPFDTRVGELVVRSGIGIGPARTIREAAARMAEESVGSLVVVEAGTPVGIVTKTDVVRRVVAAGVGPGEPVQRVMSGDLITIGADAYLFDALMTMIRNGIGHLVVTDAGRFAGVVSAGDWLAFQRNQPLALLQRIDGAPTVASLADYRSEALDFLEELFNDAGTARSLTELVTEINDRVTRRVIDISLAELTEPPPASFAWLAMGSEGRREQTLSTDQDNGLVFAHAADAGPEPVREWFLTLARRVNGHLATCGFPLCKGNTMASNPELCRSLSEWHELFRELVRRADPRDLIRASIYFDFRCLYGDRSLVERMWRDLLEHIARNRSFLRFMAGEGAVYGGSPVNSLSWRLRSLVGLAPPPVDVKRQGLNPLVRMLRVIALDLGSSETNTLDRLQLAREHGRLPVDVAESAADAYEFVMLKRLRWQSHRKDSAEPNRIDPREMNRLERTFLVEALKTIDRVEQQVRGDYGGAVIQ